MEAEYRGEHACLSQCVSLSVYEHISGTTRPMFAQQPRPGAVPVVLGSGPKPPESSQHIANIWLVNQHHFVYLAKAHEPLVKHEKT